MKQLNVKEFESLFETMDKELNIREAFVWEGYPARLRISCQIENRITFTLSGNSTVEHDGDIEGIISQVNHLRGKTTAIILEEKTYQAVIKNSKVTGTDKSEQNEDDDYQVNVKGIVEVELT